jgi:prepilin-type N-terminal cleavage/methylation domain-containing protein
MNLLRSTSYRLQSKRGFTLIEILLVIAIIAILAAIVIIAVNPSKQMLDAKTAQRKSDVNTILNAVYQYSVDNAGAIPGTATIPTSPTAAKEICTSTVSATCTTATLADLSLLIATEKYLTAIPVDPAGNVTSGAGYQIQKTANGRITVLAPAVGSYTLYQATK